MQGDDEIEDGLLLTTATDVITLLAEVAAVVDGRREKDNEEAASAQTKANINKKRMSVMATTAK